MQNLKNHRSLVKESLICPHCNMLMSQTAKFCNECGHKFVESPKGADSTSAIFIKTKMCAFHLRGKCTRGEACKFAHGNTDMTPLPDLYRTSLCSSILLSGMCANGASCKYAHTRDELRRIRTPASGKPQRQAKEPPRSEVQRPRPVAQPAQPAARPQISHASIRELVAQLGQDRMASLLEALPALALADAAASASAVDWAARAEDVAARIEDVDVPEVMCGRLGDDEASEHSAPHSLDNSQKPGTPRNMTLSTEADFLFEDGWSRQISKGSSSTTCSNMSPVNEEIDTPLDSAWSQQASSPITHDLIPKMHSDLENGLSKELNDRRCAWLQESCKLQDVQIAVKNTFLAFEERGFVKMSGTAMRRSASS
mmetsp:Transcript_154000/g.279805  ORF Transcript_154000/g.279805 Transcript_154000/m.279805 type:complete len:370 (-) Transcript_154000:71-1180(-)